MISELNCLLLEKYSIMKEVAQQQLIWFVRELVRNGIPGTDLVCWNVIRNIIGGNTSNRNLWLTVVEENWSFGAILGKKWTFLRHKYDPKMALIIGIRPKYA